MKVLLTCRACDKGFEVERWQAAPGPRQKKYCSIACYQLASVGHRSYHPDPVEERTCVACGDVFQVGGRGRPSKRARFCSEDCQRRGRYRNGAVANVLTEIDAAYLAGLVDGEGSIMINPRGDTVTARLTVTNTHRGVLHWLSEVTGLGKVQAHRPESARHRATWMWVVNGDGALSLLKQLEPFMRIKRQQAMLAIETQERLRDPALKADRSWQADYREQMRAFNLRGPRPG